MQLRHFFRALPLLFLAVSPAQAAHEPSAACVRLFTKLLKAPATKPIPDAPESIRLPGSKKEAEKSFRLSLAAWEENVDQAELSKALKRLEQDAGAAKELAPELKEARKWASILRSQYVLLEASGEPPAKFAKFTQVLGKLNDAIANEEPAAKIAELAEASRKLLKRLPGPKRMAAFEPASAKKLRSRTDEIRDAAASLLKKENSPDEFHEARKALKELLAYSQAQEALDPSPAHLNAYEFMRYLNEQMGVDNDEFVRLESMGKLDPAKDQFKLRPELVEALGAFVKAMPKE